MAMGAYYRSSGKMAVSLVTAGGGSSNSFTGILSNWADSIPGIVIAGNENSKFTDNDPFVFLPLLPLNLNITPSIGEYVNVIYMDYDNNPQKRNQFYIPAFNASPMNLTKEVSLVTKSLLGEGMNFSKPLEIKDKTGEFKSNLSK
jgi:hypothetical protein